MKGHLEIGGSVRPMTVICNPCDYPFQQMMNTCPHLREIVGSFVNVVENDPERLSKRDVTAYLENLLTFFFSPLSSELNENDVMWFLGYLNQDVDLTLQVEGEGPVTETDQSPLLNALPIAMAKRVLGEILTHPQGDEKPVPPLSIFCRKVGFEYHSHMTVT